MGVIHVHRIKAVIEKRFKTLVDISDCAAKPTDQQEDAFLSRGLAAFALAAECGISDDIAASCVTDGFDDNGIDALYFDAVDKILYLVQSKWDKSGNTFPDMAAINAFVRGFNDLIETQWHKFNAKLIKHKQTVLNALDDSDVTFVLLLIHTGSQSISTHASDAFSDLFKKVNDTTTLVSLRIIDQQIAYNIIAEAAEGSPINLEVMLHDWGVIQDPYLAYYGQIEASELAAWWQANENRLFSKNLRKLIPKSEVNDAIAETLKSKAEHFWYFNNGVTILCSKLAKKPIGGTDRKSGSFTCEGITIVNGAQTVGSIGQYVRSGGKVEGARVLARFISLENCPVDFGPEVTRATNTQNRVERRDFVSLDPEQSRLKTELWLDCSKTYAVKTGEEDPPPANGCGIVEATIALACAHADSGLAVQAKREIGKLWENIEKPPYKLLFNGSLTGLRLWRTVEILRAIDTRLRAIHATGTIPQRQRNVSVHGNRLAAHLVFSDIPTSTLGTPGTDLAATIAAVPKMTDAAVKDIADVSEACYPGSYLASLFKNAAKCKAIVTEIRKKTQAPKAQQAVEEVP